MDSSQLIMETARRLFLRYGLKSVSMDDVASEAGISKKTLYQAVASKAELIDRIIESHICTETETIQTLRENTTNALQEMLAISAMVAETLGQMSPALLFDLRKYYRKSWEKVNALQKEHIYQVIHHNLETGQRQGLYRRDMDASVIARLYVLNSLAMIDEEVFPAQAFDQANLLRNHVHYHLHGILTDEGLNQWKKLLP